MLFLPPGYEWTDGSAAAYVNWAEGQPDSHEGRETCVSADATTFKLSDSVCLTHLPFICEAATGESDGVCHYGGEVLVRYLRLLDHH